MTVTQVVAIVAPLATVVASVAVVWTVTIYQRQLNAMVKARQLDSFIVIMKYVNDLELRRARYFMYEHGEALRDLFGGEPSMDARHVIDERIRRLSGGDVTLHHVDLVLNALNNVCFLVRYGYAPSESVDAFLRNSLLHAWYALAAYIDYRRKRSDTIGMPSQYAIHLEWVVRHMCADHDEANGARPQPPKHRDDAP